MHFYSNADAFYLKLFSVSGKHYPVKEISLVKLSIAKYKLHDGSGFIH